MLRNPTQNFCTNHISNVSNSFLRQKKKCLMLLFKVMLLRFFFLNFCWKWSMVAYFQDLVGKLKDAAKSVEKAGQMWCDAGVQFPQRAELRRTVSSDIPHLTSFVLWDDSHSVECFN